MTGALTHAKTILHTDDLYGKGLYSSWGQCASLIKRSRPHFPVQSHHFFFSAVKKKSPKQKWVFVYLFFWLETVYGNKIDRRAVQSVLHPSTLIRFLFGFSNECIFGRSVKLPTRCDGSTVRQRRFLYYALPHRNLYKSRSQSSDSKSHCQKTHRVRGRMWTSLLIRLSFI